MFAHPSLDCISHGSKDTNDPFFSFVVGVLKKRQIFAAGFVSVSYQEQGFLKYR